MVTRVWFPKKGQKTFKNGAKLSILKYLPKRNEINRIYNYWKFSKMLTMEH